MTFKEQLIALDACEDAREWVAGRTLAQAWAECERGDWMLWLAARAGVDRKVVTLAKCACARLALQYVPAGEERPRIAIETAERWVRDEASDHELQDARRAVAYAADAAADAADAYAYAAYYAAYAAAAAYAAYAAYAVGVGGAHKAALLKCAELVRGIIGADVIGAQLETDR